MVCTVFFYRTIPWRLTFIVTNNLFIARLRLRRERYYLMENPCGWIKMSNIFFLVNGRNEQHVNMFLLMIEINIFERPWIHNYCICSSHACPGGLAFV